MGFNSAFKGLMYELKKKERYWRVNLLGLGPHLMKKEFTGPRSHKAFQNYVIVHVHASPVLQNLKSGYLWDQYCYLQGATEYMCLGAHVFGNTVVREKIQLTKPQTQKNRSREIRTNFWHKQTSRRPAQNPIAYIDMGFGVPRDQSVQNAACVWIIGGRSVESESCPKYKKTFCSYSSTIGERACFEQLPKHTLLD